MQINGKVRDVCVVSQLRRSVVSSEQDEVTPGYHAIHLRCVLSRPNNTEGINMLQNYVQRVTASPLSNYTLIAKCLNCMQAARPYLYPHSPNCVSSLPPGRLFFGTQWICAAAWSCPSPAETHWPLHSSLCLPVARNNRATVMWQEENNP